MGLRDRTPGVTQPSLPCACFKGSLQGCLVHPPIYEIAMHAISGSVARCVYPIPVVRKRLRVKYEFHENREYGYRMRLGADTFVIVPSLRVCHLQNSVSCRGTIPGILRDLHGSCGRYYPDFFHPSKKERIPVTLIFRRIVGEGV